MIEIKDGQVFRDGAFVGRVEGDTLVVAGKLHHKTVAQIEKETGLKVVVQAEPVEPKEPEQPKPEEPGTEPPEGTKTDGSTPPPPPEPPAPPADMGNPITEPEPPKDHRGDKTPAYVDWLFRNRPEEAAIRYANRKVARPD